MTCIGLTQSIAAEEQARPVDSANLGDLVRPLLSVSDPIDPLATNARPSVAARNNRGAWFSGN